MEENKIFEVIGKTAQSGINKRNQPYVVERLTINFGGKAATIKCPKDKVVNVGDKVKIQLGTVRGFGCAELGVVITGVIPAEATKGE